VKATIKEYLIVVGTRPEIIKMAPLIRALEENSVPYVLVHYGQHYDYDMSQQFMEELELPKPNFSFKVRAHSLGLQTGRITAFIERVVKKVMPSLGRSSQETRMSFLEVFQLSSSIGRREDYRKAVWVAGLDRLASLITICGFFLQTKVYVFRSRRKPNRSKSKAYDKVRFCMKKGNYKQAICRFCFHPRAPTT
jgi:hypothetical protein